MSTITEERIQRIEARVTAVEQGQNDNTQSLRFIVTTVAQMKAVLDDHSHQLDDHTRKLDEKQNSLAQQLFAREQVCVACVKSVSSKT